MKLIAKGHILDAIDKRKCYKCDLTSYKDMSKGIGNDQQSSTARIRGNPPRFLVAIEFHSQDAAVDHFIDLQNTGWPSGPNQKDLKLIVMSGRGDQGRIEGLEFGVGQLNLISHALAKLQ